SEFCKSQCQTATARHCEERKRRSNPERHGKELDCFASLAMTKERKKGSGTPADAMFHVPHASGVRGAPRIRRLAPPFRLRARSPAGVPPRLSPKGVVVPKAQLQARLPGTRSERALPAFACPSPVMHPTPRS